MRRILAAAALSVLLAGSAAVTTPSGADARSLPAAAGCSGVWVVVDYGSLGGGIASKCATSFGTGASALKDAGFNPSISDGFVLKIGGKPGSPDTNKAYWSYWHATGNGDGSYGDWSYSNLGANSYHPTKGNAEGWRYVSLDAGKVPPGAKPPSTINPTPTPTKTTSKPTSKPKPSTSSKPSSTRPSSTATRTTASATSKASASASAKATASGKASAAATTSSSATAPQPSEGSTAPTDAPASASAEPASPQGSGSPTGLIATAGLLVVAGAGVGGWWWLKGRKP